MSDVIDSGRPVAPESDPDRLEVTRIPHPYTFRPGDEDVGDGIVDAVELMAGAGDTADQTYRDAVDRLANDAPSVVEVIGHAYEALDEDQYVPRWALAQLLNDMRREEAMPVLQMIIKQPIPDERSSDTHAFSTVAEEVIIRTTAVEALSRLARDEHRSVRRDVLDLLREFATHEALSVRRAAVLTYLEHGGSDARRELMSELPQDQHWLLDIEQRVPSSVRQPVVPDTEANKPVVVERETPTVSR